MSRTVTYDTTAWLTPHSDPRALAGNDSVALSKALVFLAGQDMSNHWTLVGKATITLQIEDADSVVQSTVSRLRKEASAARAEGERKASYIEDQISKLLALTNEVEA